MDVQVKGKWEALIYACSPNRLYKNDPICLALQKGDRASYTHGAVIESGNP